MEGELSLVEIRNELREVRKLNSRGIKSNLITKYKILFAQLTPLEEIVMTNCFLLGKSYAACGRLISYCERQVKRIAHRSIEKLNIYINNK